MRGLFAHCAIVVLLAAAWADHHHDQDRHRESGRGHGQGHGHSRGHDHGQNRGHGRGHDHGQNRGHGRGRGHHRHSHEDDLACHRLSSPNAEFAFALYKNLKTKVAAGKNIFYSPLGISTALSMLASGAEGQTRAQLHSTLGYTMNQGQIDEAYQHLFQMLGHSQEDSKLDVGNAAAVQSGFNVREKFLTDVRSHYTGEVFNVDFTKPEDAAAEINTFIASKTHDKIKDQVKDLDPSTVMMLINYVYFRGQWEIPFNGNLTSKAEFTVDEQNKVQVDMMNRNGYYDYYSDAENHTSVILLPYKGNNSMMIVLPDEGKMETVEGFINKDYLMHLLDSLSRNSVDLFLPKFSISAQASLNETLKEMGITDAFEDHANLNGISARTKLKVSKVTHQAMLNMDEAGTEAAASTTIEIILGSSMKIPEIMKLDRPFLIFILDHSTRSILFMGKINDPTAM